jgi:hypothetical protein
MQIELKLAHDRDALGPTTAYVFNRTRGKAAVIAMFWIKRKLGYLVTKI